MRPKSQGNVLRAGALALGLAAPAAALAATPSLTWSGAEEVVVHCTVQAPGRDPAALSRALCERVRTLAAQGAPMPVRAGLSGSPMLEPATAVSLIVHAGLHTAPDAAGALGAPPPTPPSRRRWTKPCLGARPEGREDADQHLTLTGLQE